MDNVGLEWALLDTWVTIGEVSSSPTGGEIIAATVKVYSKNKAGTSALYLMDDAGSEREIAPPNTVTGTGTLNRLAYWTGTSTIGANAALTNTRIPFADANGLPKDDTTLRFSVAASIPQLFIGSTSALSGSAVIAEIDLSVGAGVAGNALFEGAGYGTGAFMNFRGRAARGVQGAGTASQANDVLARFSGLGFGATVFNTGARGAFDVIAAENMTDVANGTYLSLKTTPAGSTTMAERLRLTDTILQPGTTLVMNLGATSLMFLRYWGGDLELADQAAPSTPASGNLIYYSFNQQGFSVAHVMDSTGAQIEVARDNLMVAKNTSGGTINKGQAVYITGATGNVPNVALAKANAASTMPAVGIMFETTTNNNFGRVMMLGNIENFDTSAFTAGDELYVSTTTAGALTNVRPPSGVNVYAQQVASVLTSGVGNGSIFAHVQQPNGQIVFGVTAIYDETNNRIGVGTTSPSCEFHALDTTANTVRGFLSEQVSNDAGGAQFVYRKSLGGGTPALTTGIGIVALVGQGHDGTGYSNNAVNIRAVTLENWDATHHGVGIDFRMTPPATITLVTALSCDGNGDVVHPQMVAALASDMLLSNTTTFADISGLSLTVTAGKTYRIKVMLPLSAVSGVSSTIKIQSAGTATATIFQLQAVQYTSSGSINAGTISSSLGALIDLTNLGSTSAWIMMEGVLVVNAGGTFKLQAAQHTADATNTTTILRGACLTLERLAA